MSGGARQYCDAEVAVDSGEAIACLLAPDHHGNHEGWTQVPCPSCWGMERHVDGCPMIDAEEDVDGMALAFTDDGAYWAVSR
jgi:hypothetical protein